MRVIAIITARGGSKRIPGKNIRIFCGKPILLYSIHTAIESGLFDCVMVSTDDRGIASLATAHGAEVPFLRSARASDDYATTEDVLEEVLRQYQKMGRFYDYGCCIYPTAPFISDGKLKEAYQILESSKDCHVVFPVVRFSFPPQRGLRLKDGWLYPVQAEDYLKRSQDLEPVYHDSGQFYFFRIEAFLQTHSLTDCVRPIIVDEMQVQDIDTENDWKLAEWKYSMACASGHHLKGKEGDSHEPFIGKDRPERSIHYR